jgi:hypothetical protein
MTVSPTLRSLVGAAQKQADWTELFGRRLAVVVPYRNRPDHLSRFVPHILAYFERDKLDANLRPSIHVIEQANDEQPFNAGTLKNVGFQVTAGNHDYFCFHDIDYLPIWADYSFPRGPARLIWHGLRNQEDPIDFFGGVVLFSRTDFSDVNGYSNGYAGWGFEDTDLHIRCLTVGLEIERRDGTFWPLSHEQRGYTASGQLNEEALRNRARFHAAVAQMKRTRRIPDDGLRDLRFEVDATTEIGPRVYRHRIVF